MSSSHHWCRWQLAPYWRSIVVLLAPLLLLPLPLLSKTPEARCGYIVGIMALYWMTEAIPLAVTALIPIVGFPLLGVMDTDALCLVYMKETNMMFLGGLSVAVAVEHSNLHKRIALFVLLHVGQSPRRLMFGFMFTSMFLSMWISNTASTAMMVPIVDAIMQELFRKPDQKPEGDEQMMAVAHDAGQINNAFDLSNDQMALEEYHTKRATKDINSVKGLEVVYDDVNRAAAEEEVDPLKEKKYELTDVGVQMRKALMLAVAYSANIGGTGVVTGTTPNLILLATLQQFFPEPSGLNFGSWMAFNIPGMLLCVFMAWIWLQIIFIGCRGNSILSETTREQEENARQLLLKKYRSLGTVTFHETVVLTLFICLVFLWLFRAPGFIPGWSYWFVLAFGEIAVNDATPVMLIVVLLFIIPNKLNFWCFRDPNSTEPVVGNEGCLTWQVLHEKIPWGVVLLLGGGFAIAEASDVSGMSLWLGDQLKALDVMPVEAIVFVVSLMTCMVTEVASNTATASILMPVLKDLSLTLQVNPLYLMLPAAVCCSYAFMLPVATPPNAIVFTASNMKTTEMMKAGFMMNLLCVFSVTLMINTLGEAMFDLHTFPDWANVTET